MQPHIVTVPSDPARRRIFISDIHGNLAALTGLLDQIGFCAQDELYFLGDLIERGTQSLATVRYVMELCQTGRAQAILGNCDSMWNNVLPDNPYHDHILPYMSWRKQSLFWDMANELNLGVGPDTKVDDLCIPFRRAFEKEFQFLGGLAHIMVGPDFILAHAGLDPVPLEQQTLQRVMRRDAFLVEAGRFEKRLIVGHWPVQNYHRHICCALPIVDEEKNIACIDGGNGIKADGQLNALILEDGTIRFAFEDCLPTAAVVEGQAASRDSINITWPWREVERLEQRDSISLCRHPASGRELLIPDRYLYWQKEQLCAEYTDYRLPLCPGDRVSVIHRLGDWVLCKHQGVAGWAAAGCLGESR